MDQHQHTADELAEVRATVRALVDDWLSAGRFTPACDAWLRRYDREFTKAMAERGLIGISWPTEYGGAARSGLARLVVTEELLRAGAPVAAHWIADRQIGPSILQHGTPAAKHRYLPGIARGEITFCLGMSETEAGSDLASVRTTATREDGGWSLTGRKIWTSQAHRSSHAYVLARTSKGENKHEGLTEFLVDMSDPGVTVRPLYDLRGDHHFNEVTFDAVHVPDDHVLGQVGAGWDQVTAQLSLERGGIERVLSTYPLLAAALDALAARESADPAPAGEILARLTTLRAMAHDVAAAIEAGRAPVHEAAMLKDLGTVFEREAGEFARAVLDREPDPSADGPAGLLAEGILATPGFTIRGGTTEVLRTLVARGVTRGAPAGTPGGDAELAELRTVVDDVLADQGGEPGDQPGPVWRTVQDLGWPRVGVDEQAGGEGGDLRHAVEIVEGLGRHGVSVPLAETLLAHRMLAAAGHPLADHAEVLTVAVPGGSERVLLRRDGSGRPLLSGAVARVPWGRAADRLVVPVERADGGQAVVVLARDAPGLRWEPGRNLAGEPRDALILNDVAVDADQVLTGCPGRERIVAEAALLRAAALVGALHTTLTRTVEHVTAREQFGRPLIRFQAVAGLLAVLASEQQSARVALDRAVAAVHRDDADAWTRVAAARVIGGRAATEGARIAHQLHGAMGVTREYPLHLSTRRLWAWRDECGTQHGWSARLGRHLLGRSADARWRWITEQPPEHTGE